MKLSFTKAALLPMAAALAAGCATERIESPDTGDKISISAIVGRQTTVSRAKEFGYWQAGMKLNVKAYTTGLTDETPYHDFDLTYNAPYTTSWTYSPTIDVPHFSLTYYAYHPETANISDMKRNGVEGSFSYTVPAINEDIVAAKTVSSSARVALMFHHLLSEVNFALQEIPKYHINVTNIRVNAVADSGHYVFSPGGGTWSQVTGSASYPYTPIPSVTMPTSGKDDENGILYFGNMGGNNPTDNDRTNALMLMPQSFSSATGGNISFEYTLTDMNGNVAKQGGTRVYLGDLTTSQWMPGKRYLYLIDLTGLIEGGPINFEVIMFGWSDAIQNVAQPIVVAALTQLQIESAITAHNSDKALTPALTVFPISLPNGDAMGVNDRILLKDFSYGSFAPGDQIRIQCDNDFKAARITLDPSLLDTEWSRSVNETVVTLTKL